jgi:beta-glucosidase
VRVGQRPQLQHKQEWLCHEEALLALLASPALLCHNALNMRIPKFGYFVVLCLSPLLACAQAPSTPSSATTATTTPAYLDPSLPLDRRVNDLVSRMTLEEKVAQMQDVAPAIPRLQVPAYNWWNEGLHGVARSGIATVFPQAIGLGATWDTGLVHQIADIISTEARGKYNDAIAHHNTGRYYGLTFWSPNINIFRDPRWGRGQETYGEDPFLTGKLGVAFVTGLQGNDPRYLKTVSTPKHYAVHSGPESLRHRFNVPVSLHDLYDTYTPAFRATVVDGHADSIMCAYNSILGEPACANELLFNLLRNQWGFRGYVVSDCGAINDLYQAHEFVMDLDQASALSVKAGTDLSCGSQFKILDYAVEDRLLAPQDVDRSVRRLFEARFRLGMFDPPSQVPWSNLTLADVDTAANRKVALQAARESIVLLKNEHNILPLKSSIRSIAVIGPAADSLDALLGNYNGSPSTYTTVLTGIKKRFPNAKISFAVGAPLTETSPIPIPASAFRTAATEGTGSTHSQPGLNVEFFANTRLTGPAVATRVDPYVNFEWNNVPPAPGVPAENYSARWTGVLIPPVDGDYRLGASTDGGYRLYFQDKLLIDDWEPHSERALTTLVHLRAGHAYPIKLEYYHGAWESAVRLLWLPPNLEQEAVDAARKSDLVIAVVGITAQLEGEESERSDPGFFGGDRTDITLPTTQQHLLEALAATGKPIVVVLTSGSAMAVNWANDHAAAILQAWYPGEEGGAAVADVLSGDYNPAGRLPVTFYKSVAQLPPFTDYSMANRTYRYLNEKPLYPFGFGLSYSTFSYSEPAVADLQPVHHPDPAHPAVHTDVGPDAASLTEIPGNAPVYVSARVENTSKLEGDEVVELYLAHPGIDGAPIRSLEGFQRVHLAPGAFKFVSFVLTPRELSVVDLTGHRMVPTGPVEVWVGSSQPSNIPEQPAVSAKAGKAAPAVANQPGVALKFTVTETTPLPN